MKYLFEIICCIVAFILVLVISKLAKLEKEANNALDELKTVVTEFNGEVEDIKVSMNDSVSKITKLDICVDEIDDAVSVNKAEIYALMQQLKDIQSEIEKLKTTKGKTKSSKKKKAEETTENAAGL